MKRKRKYSYNERERLSTGLTLLQKNSLNISSKNNELGTTEVTFSGIIQKVQPVLAWNNKPLLLLTNGTGTYRLGWKQKTNTQNFSRLKEIVVDAASEEIYRNLKCGIYAGGYRKSDLEKW